MIDKDSLLHITYFAVVRNQIYIQHVNLIKLCSRDRKTYISQPLTRISIIYSFKTKDQKSYRKFGDSCGACRLTSMLMMTSSNGNIFRVTGPLCGEFTGPGEFPTQRPVTRSFDVFFDLRLNKQLNKQSWGWWFETLSRPFWRHRNVRGLFWCPFILVKSLQHNYTCGTRMWNLRVSTLQWRHNKRYCVSNHRRLDSLLNRLFGKKHQSCASLAFVRGIHRWTHKGPVTRKMFPFHDVIMQISNELL